MIMMTTVRGYFTLRNSLLLLLAECVTQNLIHLHEKICLFAVELDNQSALRSRCNVLFFMAGILTFLSSGGCRASSFNFQTVCRVIRLLFQVIEYIIDRTGLLHCTLR